MNRRIAFVCRKAIGEALRSANAIGQLRDVTLLVISEDSDMVRVNDVHDASQLIDAAKQLGSLHRIITAQETLLAPVAAANEALGLEAMSSEVVARTLDKSQLKATLKSAGIKTPRHEVVNTADDARRFASEAGLPIVLKPLNGSGAVTTFCITTEDQLTRILELIKAPVIAETYVNGQELCFDTVTIANEPQCYSICCYDPPILDALEDPHRRWRCVMPRDLSAYEDFIAEGTAAVRALQVGNALTHMEGFINSAGPAGFVDATLRPAGARIGPMFGFAFDVDPYRMWARAVVDGCFDGPLERKFAVGTIFLRGAGAGTVQQVDGIERVEQEFKDLLVDARSPRIGASKSATYTGDGFVTVRHQHTETVQDALRQIAELIKITYSSDSQLPSTTWEHRLQNFHELNRPAWDQAN